MAHWWTLWRGASRGDERPFRWFFSDITNELFKRRAVKGDPAGQTWKRRQEMFARRRLGGPTADGSAKG